MKLNNQLAREEMRKEIIREQINILREQYDSQLEIIRVIKENIEEIKLEDFRTEQVKRDALLLEKDEKEQMRGKRLNAALGRNEVRKPDPQVRMRLID